MKKSLQTILAGLLLTTSFNNQVIGQTIPNAGFENWTGSGASLVPTGWTSYSFPNTLHTSAGRSGLSALRMNALYSSSTGFYEGGYVEIKVGPIPNYYPTSLHGYWRTLNTGGVDFLGAHLYLYDANDNYINDDNAFTPMMTSLSNWTAFNVNVSGGVLGGYYLIALDFINSSNLSSNYGEFDDLSLTVATSTGEEIIKLSDQYYISSPTFQEYVLNMDLLKTQELTVDIINLNGQIIESSHEVYGPGHNESQINLYGLSNGIYVCRVNGEGFTKQFKILKQL